MEINFDRFITEVQSDFWAYAKKVLEFQRANNQIFEDWIQHAPSSMLDGENFDFKFLPISFYKTQRISSIPNGTVQKEFLSSGTTADVRSRLEVYRPDWYHQNTILGFESFFTQDLNDLRILALLPGYLDSPHSSLVDMVSAWMQINPTKKHAFFPEINAELMAAIQSDEPTMIIGVSFALIDLAEQISEPLENMLIIETGGMKGRRAEWTKPQLHSFLGNKLGQPIYSEYGMTELTSQAYMKAGKWFIPPPTMKVLVRDETDPCRLFSSGRGALNIIDLANMDSCAFIATDDLVDLQADGSFQILGRLSASDIRGCSQLYLS